MEVAEGAFFTKGRGINVKEAAVYAGISEEYARRALEATVQLGIMSEDSGKYFTRGEVDDVSRATKDQHPIIFRRFVQRYEPFILFLMLVGKGNTIDSAARKISVIYDVDSPPTMIEKTLTEWGKYADLIEVGTKGGISLKIETEKLSAEYIKELLEAMEHDVKARIYIASKLGEDVFGYLKHDEIEFLVSAIRKHQEDPRNALDDAGRAFEDYLRRLGTDRGVNMSGCKGIGELSDYLKGSDLIDQKHLEICKAINSVRLAAAHSKDRKTITPWKINPDAAIEAILITLTAMRSIHNFVSNKTQIF
jgi:hypothetical protein